MHDRHLGTDLILGNVHDALLFFESAGRGFRGVRVDGDRRQTRRRRDVAQMGAVGCLIDGQIGCKRQQDSGDDAFR
jgi:hypothetical protein